MCVVCACDTKLIARNHWWLQFLLVKSVFVASSSAAAGDEDNNEEWKVAVCVKQSINQRERVDFVC
jgi:hypothetical protein